MFVDSQLLLSDSQAVTAAAASTNYIDLAIARDIGTGEDLYLVSVCKVAMTDSGSDSTLAVTVETDDNTSFSSALTAQTAFTFSATSAAGTIKIAKLSPQVINERYMQVRYTPANGNLSTGSFSTFITNNIDRFVGYAKGYTIS